MKILSLCCGVVSAILLTAGATLNIGNCVTAGGVLLALTFVFWFLSGK
jgi:hypothetical protein